MTRKDYVAIAAAIKVSTLPPYKGEDPPNSRARQAWNDACLVVARNIADVLQADNVRFDRARFLTACGV